MANDVIRVQGISVLGYHGVHQWERTQGQQFLVDLELTVDASKAAQSDDISDTVDYSALAKQVHDLVASNPCNLIETVGLRVAEKILENPLVNNAKVTIHKPHADCGVEANDVSVTIERGRECAPAESPVSETNTEVGSAEPADEPAVDEPEIWADPEIAAGPVVSAGPEVVADPEIAADPEQTYVLSLGANLGQPEHNLRWAVGRLANHGEISLTGASPLVKTPAELDPEQQPQSDYSNAVVTLKTSLSPEQLFAYTQSLEIEAGRVLGQHWQPRPLDIDIIAIGMQQGSTENLTIPHPRAHERIFVLGPWAMLDQSACLPGYGSVADLADSLPTRDDIVSFDAEWLEQGYPESPYQEEDLAKTSSPGEGFAVAGIPRRQSIRDRLQTKDPRIEQMEQELLGNIVAPGGLESPESSAPFIEPEEEITLHGQAARTSTSLRRIVVRPTTTGTIPVLPADYRPDTESGTDPQFPED